MDEIIINKSDSIKRCIRRIEEDFDEEFENNFTKQDAVILNIQRAIQQAIDLGTYIIKQTKLEIPKSSREVFEILEKNKIISKELSKNLQKMVGFRNLALHEYDNLDLSIVEYIVRERIWDLIEFIKEINEIKSFD
ncbi:type VII toxin-antitoxin system HepT family RNase toxin [Caminibacter sp.]